MRLVLRKGMGSELRICNLKNKRPAFMLDGLNPIA
jgi:hypothetical protein